MARTTPRPIEHSHLTKQAAVARATAGKVLASRCARQGQRTRRGMISPPTEVHHLNHTWYLVRAAGSPCTSCALTGEYGRHAKKACPPYRVISNLSKRSAMKANARGLRRVRDNTVSHRVLGVCFTDGIWRAGALPLRGQQEFLVKEVSRKLFSSEQASDGREAHRGRQSTPELCSRCLLHLPATAAGDGGLSTHVSHTTRLHANG
eukprot:scaffold1753_cov90-Phaeocystis_antarctica.AAC.2